MDNQVNLNSFMDTLKKNKIITASIPMGYIAGLPMVSIKKKRVCLTVPYFKFNRSNEADKSLIHPIKYVVTVLWTSGRIIGFEDLEYNPKFEKVDFQRAIGMFRHDGIKQYPAGQYREKKKELYSMYDKFIGFLQNGTEYTAQDEDDFKSLLNVILEPSLIPIYRVLDRKFAARFITDADNEEAKYV